MLNVKTMPLHTVNGVNLLIIVQESVNKSTGTLDISSIVLNPGQNNNFVPSLTIGSWRAATGRPIGCLNFWINEAEFLTTCVTMPKLPLPEGVLPNEYFESLLREIVSNNGFLGIKVIDDEQRKGVGSLMWSLGLSALRYRGVTACKVHKDGTLYKDPGKKGRSFYYYITLGSAYDRSINAYTFTIGTGLNPEMQRRIEAAMPQV